MNIQRVGNYAEMSRLGAQVLYDAATAKLRKGEPFNLGLATGNTMIELYRLLAEMFNREKLDLSLLSTWNLDEYADTPTSAVARNHPLSYKKYMSENLFSRFDPKLGFKETNAHFPDPADPEAFDRALGEAGGIDLQLLGLGFNGHIAFNEPISETEISAAAFAALPTRVIALKELTIETNARLTADGDRNQVPHYAATMGMKQILEAKKILLLTCFEEQTEPLHRILELTAPTPELPGSYLIGHPNARIVYTGDLIVL